jgi:hypothetical protein
MAMPRNFDGIWIPRALWEEPSLSWPARLILREIISLDGGADGCFATNAHFAEFAKVTIRAVREVLQRLEAAGYITQQISVDRQHRTLHALKTFGIKPATGEVAAGVRGKLLPPTGEVRAVSSISEKYLEKYRGEGPSLADVPMQKVADLFNSITGRNEIAYPETGRAIAAIWAEMPSWGVGVKTGAEGMIAAFEAVFRHKAQQWGDPKMSAALKLANLLKSPAKFNGYLNETPEYQAVIAAKRRQKGNGR